MFIGGDLQSPSIMNTQTKVIAMSIITEGVDVKTVCTFKGGMRFDSEVRGHNVVMDAKAEFGGTNQGPSPKEYVLAGMCGCTGMDVVSLLKKMRVEYGKFYINADAELTNGHPSVFSVIKIDYLFDNVVSLVESKEKIIKSVTMSMSKYCGVSAMLAKTAQIKLRIIVDNSTIFEGDAVFT